MKKRIILLIFFLYVLTPSSARSDTSLDLDQLIQEALQANPDIIAVKKKRDALWERPAQAKAWDDPRLEFGVRNVPADDADFTKEDMTAKEVQLSQSIPLPGITSLREKIAVREAKSADRLRDYTMLQVVMDVKKAYYDLSQINCHIRTTEKNQGLLAQFVDIARTKYAVGTGSQQDVLRAQIEHAKFIEHLIDMRQQKATAAARMNRLLGRNPAAPLSGEPELETATVRLDEEALVAAAMQSNPALLGLREMIGRNEADYQLARKSYVPEITLSGAYGQRENAHRGRAYPAVITGAAGAPSTATIRPLDRNHERSDMFSVMLGVNIPIWFNGKQSRKVAETHHMIEQAKAEHSALGQELAFRIRDLAARQTRETQLMELYEKGIIPQARQSLSAAIAGYKVGKSDFLSLLDSQVTLCTAELQLGDAQARYRKNMAEIEAVVGEKPF